MMMMMMMMMMTVVVVTDGQSSLSYVCCTCLQGSTPAMPPRPRVKITPGRVPRTNPEVEAIIRAMLLLHGDVGTREGDAAKPPIAAAAVE